MKKTIPTAVTEILTTLHDNDHQVFIVGGCVRDLLLDKTPKDWDVTTDALPEKIQELFPDSFYENNFGTVGVKVEPFLDGGKKDREHDVVEVTTFRKESGYSDRRRPDTIEFVKNILEDLGRRDFTINALAIGNGDASLADHSVEGFEIDGYIMIDPFGGKNDLENKTIKAVGDARERFSEDALRMMRAVRLSSELGFQIEETTLEAINSSSELLKEIAIERIRDEFSRIVLSDNAMAGIELLHQTRLLQYIVPELEMGIGVEQNHHHIYDVWEHNLRALDTTPSKKLEVRLATLFHDIAKPHTKRGTGRNCTFYNHDHVGARVTRKRLRELRYPTDIIEKAALLVDQHMFYYNVGEVTEKSVRRLLKKVGKENIKDLIDVRIGDRLGSGTPKGKVYKLRHFEYMVEKVSKDPVTVKMLAVDGSTLMEELGIKPGPIIGAILDVLLAEVIEDPGLNTKETLLDRAKELQSKDLPSLRELSKEKIEEKRKEDDEDIKKKHWVK